MRTAEINTSLPIVKPSEYVCQPPFIDIEKAKQSRTVAERFLNDESTVESPALSLAVALSLYNQTRSPQKASRDEQLGNQFRRLIESEQNAANTSNQLPTIGWEVESPMFPYWRQTENNINYLLHDFENKIGIPSNGINSVHSSNLPAYWEFASPPSYSAEVSARILSELIKGRFVPSLKQSQKPEDIEKYIFDKLISFHINLGVPFHVSESHKTAAEDDGEYLASILALAFSSPLRLSTKKTGYVAEHKSADQTGKPGQNRLEMKALEIRDSSSYTQIYCAQLLGASLFAYCGETDQELAKQWEELKNKCSDILPRESVVLDASEKHLAKHNLAYAALNPESQIRTRSLVSQHSRLVAQYIRSKQ